MNVYVVNVMGSHAHFRAGSEGYNIEANNVGCFHDTPEVRKDLDVYVKNGALMYCNKNGEVNHEVVVPHLPAISLLEPILSDGPTDEKIMESDPFRQTEGEATLLAAVSLASSWLAMTDLPARALHMEQILKDHEPLYTLAKQKLSEMASPDKGTAAPAASPAPAAPPPARSPSLPTPRLPQS